jgi:hypothetical protein
VSRVRANAMTLEAVNWNGQHFAQPYAGILVAGDPPEWLITALGNGSLKAGPAGTMHVQGRDGAMLARPGYWIIKGADGYLVPCHPDLFAASYTLVE